MSDGATPAPLERAERRALLRQLTRSSWRMWDIGLFHLLQGVAAVGLALLVSVLVVATTRTDGNVRVSVGFVAVLVAVLAAVLAAIRTGLHSAERRAGATVASEARAMLLRALADGAPIAPGAAAAFVTTSSADVGTYLARSRPSRLAGALVAVLVLVVEGLVDPWSAVITLAVLLAAPVVLRSFGRAAQREATTSLGRLRSLSTRTLELLEGAVELRALGALKRGRTELGAATERAVASTRSSLRVALRSGTAIDLLAGAAVGLVAMTDGFRLLAGQLMLGHALAAVLLTAEAFAPVRSAGTAFHAGVDGRAALDVLAAARSATPGSARTPPSRDLPAAGAAPATVRADGVALRACAGGPVVAAGLDFRVPAGGALLVTGPSGSGKSTLLRALAGAPLVATGVLLVGNAPPSSLSARQRAALLAAVDQHPVLVAGTLRENLELGSRSPRARLDEVVERCGLSGLLSRAPRGLGEDVGEDGRLLSAGERTRVALARALLREPGVLLLDELGAHLDDAAIVALRTGVAELLEGRTVIEAAHARPLLVGVAELALGDAALAEAG